MNPDKPPILVYAEGKPFAVFCPGLHSAVLVSTYGGSVDDAIRSAAACAQCVPPRCETHGPYEHYCRSCSAEKALAKLHAAFDRAKKLPIAEYDGEMVAGDDIESFAAADSWDSIEDDAYVLDDGTRFLWGTSPETPKVELDRELEGWIQETHESACEQVDYRKLAEAQELVNEALSGVVSYYPDESIALILPPREEESRSSEVA